MTARSRHAEIDTLAHWADAGAPAGDPKDCSPAARLAGRLEHRNAGCRVRNAARVSHSSARRHRLSIRDSAHCISPKTSGSKSVEVRPSRSRHGASRRGLHPRARIEMAGRRTARRRLRFSVPPLIRRASPPAIILMVYTPGNSYDQWTPGMAKRIKAGLGPGAPDALHRQRQGQRGPHPHRHRVRQSSRPNKPCSRYRWETTVS